MDILALVDSRMTKTPTPRVYYVYVEDPFGASWVYAQFVKVEKEPQHDLVPIREPIP